MNKFMQDTWRGLNAPEKFLLSKYFYDDQGDAIFREIMNCPEYYPTKCEAEIFTGQRQEMAEAITTRLEDFAIVELGAGDCSKSASLLQTLLERQVKFTYYPIDISTSVITDLNNRLPVLVPGIRMHGLNGEYFDMLDKLSKVSEKNKVILFLGSSIGNIPLEENAGFYRELHTYLQTGDLVLTGFDLVKEPDLILAAYNDEGGATRRFNLNLLHRINHALSADFDLEQFEHKPVYDREAGACKSYLESRCEQEVRIGQEGTVHFRAGEKIYMEISQKYTVAQTDEIAISAGFKPIAHYHDSKKWFLDALWECC